MSFNYISSYMLSSTLRYSIVSNQSALSQATKEATTGRFADVGLELGASTGRDVSLRAQMSFMDQMVDTNALIAGRLDVTQNAIGEISSTAQEFLKSLIAARDADNGGKIILPNAAANLQDLISTLNVDHNGSHVFAGINTQVAPLANYAPGSTSKNAIDAAFFAAFGFTQASPLVSTITPAAMQTFLNTGFAAEFVSTSTPPPGPWNLNWSSATAQVTNNRISTTEVVNTSVSANDPNFRALAEAYTMVSDLGTASLSKTTFQVVVDKAISLVSGAANGLALLGGNVGSIQQQVSTASDKLKTQRDLLNNQIVDMEKVDPAEASVRVNALQTQIQTALSLTAQMQKISLVNYL